MSPFWRSSAKARSDFSTDKTIPRNISGVFVNCTSQKSTTCTWFPHGSRNEQFGARVTATPLRLVQRESGGDSCRLRARGRAALQDSRDSEKP